MRVYAVLALAVAATCDALPINGWYPCTATRDSAVYFSLPDFDCAKIEVPLCYDGICESNKTTELFVKRKLADPFVDSGSGSASDGGATQDPVPPKTVWFLEGGPGASSVNMEQAMLLLYSIMGDSINIYTVDHRGTGRSGYLQCEAAQALAEGSPGGQELQFGELGTCVQDVLYEIDGNTAAYSVTSAATDIVTLLDFLVEDKEEQVYLYGVSYGTYLVERVMHLAPPQVKGYILDGVVSETGLYFSDWNKNLLPPTRRFFEACFDSPACPIKFKSRETVVEEVLQMMDDIDASVDNNTCAASVSFALDDAVPSTSLRSIFGVLVRDSGWRFLVPSLLVRIHRCSRQDKEDLDIIFEPLLQDLRSIYGMASPRSVAERLRAWAKKWKATSKHSKHATKSSPQTNHFQVDPVSAPSILLYLLISFSEMWEAPLPSSATLLQEFHDGPFSVQAVELATYCLLTGDLNNENEPRDATCGDIRKELLSFDEFIPEIQAPFVYKHDQYWNKSASLAENASVLLIVGGQDFQTPKEFGEQQYASMDAANKLLVEFEFGGHGAGFMPVSPEDNSECGPRIIASFIDNEGDVVKVDTSCVDLLPPLVLDDAVFLQAVEGVKASMPGGPGPSK